MKKIELHVHLDGSLNPTEVNKIMNNETRSLLIGKNKTSLEQYLNTFDLPIKLLQTRENLINFSKTLAMDLYEDDVIYAEIRFCPLLHTSILSKEEVVEAVLEGLRQVPEVKTRLILCMMRQFSMDKNLEIVKLAKNYLNKGVVGLDLAGDEARYKTATFKQLFEIIKIDNIPFTIHAGEADGIESIEQAISFGAKRIGHGIRAIESEETINKIIKNNVTLEVCPTSNLDTGVYKNMDEYPVKKLIDKGVKITINTDNRTVSNTTLEKEYTLLKENFKLTKNDFLNFNLNAIEASFLSESEKAELKYQLTK